MDSRALSTAASIVQTIGERFRTFGGGRGSEFNPLAQALKDQRLQFAAGVDVEDVVATVAAAERARIRRELLEEIKQGTVYVQWVNGISQGVDEPFVVVADLYAALDRIAPEEE
jgi:pilus assembly protein TadC